MSRKNITSPSYHPQPSSRGNSCAPPPPPPPSPNKPQHMSKVPRCDLKHAKIHVPHNYIFVTVPKNIFQFKKVIKKFPELAKFIPSKRTKVNLKNETYKFFQVFSLATRQIETKFQEVIVYLIPKRAQLMISTSLQISLEKPQNLNPHSQQPFPQMSPFFTPLPPPAKVTRVFPGFEASAAGYNFHPPIRAYFSGALKCRVREHPRIVFFFFPPFFPLALTRGGPHVVRGFTSDSGERRPRARAMRRVVCAPREETHRASRAPLRCVFCRTGGGGRASSSSGSLSFADLSEMWAKIGASLGLCSNFFLGGIGAKKWN